MKLSMLWQYIAYPSFFRHKPSNPKRRNIIRDRHHKIDVHLGFTLLITAWFTLSYDTLQSAKVTTANIEKSIYNIKQTNSKTTIERTHHDCISNWFVLYTERSTIKIMRCLVSGDGNSNIGAQLWSLSLDNRHKHE